MYVLKCRKVLTFYFITKHAYRLRLITTIMEVCRTNFFLLVLYEATSHGKIDLIHVKQPHFCTKSNQVYVGLWIHVEKLCSDSRLHCSCISSAVRPSFYYITAKRQQTLNHPHLFATFPFPPKTQSSFFPILLFSFFPTFHFFLLSFSSTSTNREFHLDWGSVVKRHVWS